MASQTIIKNLSSFAQSYKDARSRVTELEDSIGTAQRADTAVRMGLDVANNTIRRLDSEKEMLLHQVSALQETVKVEQERLAVNLEQDAKPNLSSRPAEKNTVLAETREMYAKEKQLNEELTAKCTDLETRLDDITGAAGTILEAKAETEEARRHTLLKVARLELEEQNNESKRLQRTCDELAAANVEAASRAAAQEAALVETHNSAKKYDSIKLAKKELRSRCDQLRGQIGFQTDALSELEARYDQVTAEREDLQETCRQLIELVENHEQEAARVAEMTIEPPDAFEKLQARYDKAKKERNEFRDKCVSLEDQVKKLTEEKASLPLKVTQSEFTVAMEQYRAYMGRLPFPEDRPRFQLLQPVYWKDRNLHAYLADDPSAKSFLNHVLYLPKRSTLMAKVHCLAFAPTHRYDHVKAVWTEGSDLTSLHGGTRELFVVHGGYVIYAGLYKCHDLRELYPGGTAPNSHTSYAEISDAALGPCSLSVKDRTAIVRQCFPDGIIRVEAIGLQCVGFNRQLYDSLRGRFADLRTKDVKRKAGDDGRVDKHPKQRKT
ncbi:hypothetical protein B0H10DRAFT_2216333 [Mycena sp. CBHHK59/15]|nr:hypothetical protein B0H10DRAFT_2216333 [Mycena sp. CBHHK59/15]